MVNSCVVKLARASFGSFSRKDEDFATSLVRPACASAWFSTFDFCPQSQRVGVGSESVECFADDFMGPQTVADAQSG
jgi:hypothetical protein